MHRIFKMKSRLQDRSNRSDSDGETFIEGVEIRPHRNSFRRSLKKMHTRVKSCMFSQEVVTPKRPVTISEVPCTSSRVIQGPPPVPERPRTLPEEEEEEPPPPREPPAPVEPRTHRIPTDEIVSLSNCYWYWGPMPTAEAEERLQFKPDGTFLVRDSSSTSYLFSISFRSVGKTMHARIEYSRGRYNLCGTYAEGFSTVTELIHDAMKTSENGIYCYSRRGEHTCEFPVRLTKPISRYTEVRSLKHLCKFVIRQYVNMNDIPQLPLPTVLHSYLLEKPYF